MANYRKAAMIGCGFVGSASVFALMQSGLFSEIAMIDVDKEKAEGEAMDISHGIPFAKQMKIYAGDYDDIKDASLVIITAGANQKPGETVTVMLCSLIEGTPCAIWGRLYLDPFTTRILSMNEKLKHAEQHHD